MHTGLLIQAQIEVIFELFKVRCTADGMKIFIAEREIEMHARKEHKALSVAFLQLHSVICFTFLPARKLCYGYLALVLYVRRIAVHPKPLPFFRDLAPYCAVKLCKLFNCFAHAAANRGNKLYLVFTEIPCYSAVCKLVRCACESAVSINAQSFTFYSKAAFVK